MCPIFECIKKCMKQRKHNQNPDPSNPFRDVKMIHTPSGDSEYISVSLAASKELEKKAIGKTIAELLAIEMINEGCVEISETTSSESPEVVYIGRVLVKKPDVSVN